MSGPAPRNRGHLSGGVGTYVPGGETPAAPQVPGDATPRWGAARPPFLAARRPQPPLALRGVAGRKPRLYIAGMAGELGHAIRDLFVQQAKEPFDPDLLEMGIAIPLPVELRDMADFRVASHWHRDAPRPREHLREHARVMVHIVMRVQMGGERPDEFHEPRHLPLEVGACSLSGDR